MRKTKTDKFFDKLTLANDFVFKMVLENEEICKRLIEMRLRPSGRSGEFRYAKHRNAVPPRGSQSGHGSTRIRVCGCDEYGRGAIKQGQGVLVA